MRDLFPGFYERTPEELSMIWQEAFFVFDTNMLLNIYQYQEETRNRFFEILERLKDRIWIPHQVAYEYEKNRIDVIEHQTRVYDEVANVLGKSRENLESLGERKHSFIKAEELTKDALAALGTAITTLTQNGNRHKTDLVKLIASDDRKERLYQLLQGKIGEPYKRDELFDIYQKADKRFELKIPPGWKDEGKGKSEKPYRKYGDVIIWFQIIDYACSCKRSIIFITDDKKSDWYLSAEKSKGSIRLQPELVQEMLTEANILIHMYPGDNFIKAASNFLNLEEVPSILADATAVTEENTSENQEIKKYPNLFAIHYETNKAVTDWIRTKYPQSTIAREYQSLKRNRNIRFDYMVLEPNGTKIAIEKLRLNMYISDFKSQIEMIEKEVKIAATLPGFDKMNIIIVADDLEYALDIAATLESRFTIPENIFLTIGYIVDSKFQVVNVIPME